MFESCWSGVASKDNLLDFFLNEIHFLVDNGVCIDWDDEDEHDVRDEMILSILSRDFL